MYTILAMIDWTESLKDRIVKGLEEQSLRKLCASHPDLPSRDAITDRMKRDDEFAARCARAREEHAEFMDDRILEVAQKVENGELEPRAGSVIISAFQWRAAKLKPKKYGDRTEHTGANGGPITIANITAADLSDEQLAAIIQTDKSADKA